MITTLACLAASAFVAIGTPSFLPAAVSFSWFRPGNDYLYFPLVTGDAQAIVPFYLSRRLWLLSLETSTSQLHCPWIRTQNFQKLKRVLQSIQGSS